MVFLFDDNFSPVLIMDKNLDDFLETIPAKNISLFYAWMMLQKVVFLHSATNHTSWPHCTKHSPQKASKSWQLLHHRHRSSFEKSQPNSRHNLCTCHSKPLVPQPYTTPASIHSLLDTCLLMFLAINFQVLSCDQITTIQTAILRTNCVQEVN